MERALLLTASEAAVMHHTDKLRQKHDEQSAKKDRSKRADTGAAPEQSDELDDQVDPREKRQDPPVPGQPKKIRVKRSDPHAGRS